MPMVGGEHQQAVALPVPDIHRDATIEQPFQRLERSGAGMVEGLVDHRQRLLLHLILRPSLHHAALASRSAATLAASLRP